jgi:uncharacterized protein YfaS (alpha-2-macroglobulin family)
MAVACWESSKPLRIVLGLMLIMGLGGCGSGQDPASKAPRTARPTVYLLAHDQWTPQLVLNFPEAVAPWDAVGQPPARPPALRPAVAGTWRWQDPSRLTFLPERQTFAPDTPLRIELAGLPLREGYQPAVLPLDYRTPPLKLLRLDCLWRDIPGPPARRAAQAALHFNYPVYDPDYAARLDTGTPVPFGRSRGLRIAVESQAMLRPDRDGALTFELKSGTVRVADRDHQQALVPGVPARLEQGASCGLALNRGDWSRYDEPPKRPPTATGVNATVQNGKLAARLEGDHLVESARKAAAGQVAKSGVTLSPAVAGTWTYGDAADGPDLIFTPAKPEWLLPGTRYDITVAAEAFPRLIFSQSRLTAGVTTPPMEGTIDRLEFHTDPVDPRIKRATATLSFAYPLERGSLEAHAEVRFRVEPVKSFSDSRVRSIPYELSYDERNPKVAYLKTAPLALPEEPGEIRLFVGRGVMSSFGGAGSWSTIERDLAIPGIREYFRVTSVEASTAIQENGEVERLLIVQTTTPLRDAAALAGAVEAFLLPDCSVPLPERPALCQDKDIREWQTPDQVDEATLKLSSPVPVAFKDSPGEDRTRHLLSFAAPEKRQVFVKVRQGLESVEGFRLAEDARHLVALGGLEREVKILHDGALLSLTGEKKLGVAARGVPKVHVELQRVLPHNMHHFAAFTEGDFQRPDFNLPIEHFAEKIAYDETLPAGREMARQYFAVDFGRFVRDKGFPPRGLFLLTVSENKPEQPACPEAAEAEDETESESEAADPDNPEAAESGESDESEEVATEAENEDTPDGCESDGEYAEAPVQDRRLVLVTDLGMLVKTARDGRQDVFVMSFRSGQPVAGAQVWLLGRNGVAVASGKTDAAGRAPLPSVEGLKEEKTPTVYLAEKDNDLSFLPYSKDNRRLDLSRFDIGGLRDGADALQAFVFSDRGIYRPGDTVHFGLILRKRDWSPLPPGLPLEAVITDPEGQEVETRTVGFGPDGFEELGWETAAGGKTGTYRVELFVARDRKKPLGQATVRVEEFQPDRLQVRTEIVGAPATGWLAPEAAKAKVAVRNLFGTPAAGGTAKLELTVRPWTGRVPGFPEYRFRTSDPAGIPALPRDLGEATTDDQGEAYFELPLAGIAEPVYAVTVAGEGFEKGSGRSVVGVASGLVARSPFLLGYAADGDLGYLRQGSEHPLKLLAVGPDFQPRAVPELRAELHEVRYASTLVKREDGLYAYQSVRRDEPRAAETVALTGGRASYRLPTATPGQFYLVFKTVQGEELNRVEFGVAGEGNVTRDIERNAELNLKLDKPEYEPGEDIEVQIVAPYAGAGLITLEQDGVIASRWIKTTTTASTHRITLPLGTLGNGYLSVAFVRSLDSPEIYMSPLSYGVVPFTVSRREYTNEVSLSVPETVRPGGNLAVRYQVRDATKLVLYAVDEGILQFAHYKNPRPLDHLFRKRALQVRTHQILDLILPDFALVQQLSRPGGDEDAEVYGKYKNPFARKHQPPVAFWSGILDAPPGEHTLSIPVPDHFNGSLRVLAVAVNARQVATPVASVTARQPFVIQPQQPYAVAPGDEFDLGVLVANTTGEPGDKTVRVAVEPGAALELLSPNPASLTLGPGRDGTARFRARALDKLGPAAVAYRVSGGGHEAGYSEELSIRPAQPLMTTFQTGVLRTDEQQAGKTAVLDLKRAVHPEQRHAELAVSMTPMAYLRGVVEYLKTYPYGCTEQVTSQSFPAVVLGGNPELGLSKSDVERFLGRTLAILKSRQKYDGSFAYWSVAGEVEPFYSMYATHLLLEARVVGLQVPEAMFTRAMGHVDRYTQETHYDWRAHQAQAYGLYLLARNGANVAERLRVFEAELERQWGQGGSAANWVRFFLGAAYKLHHLDRDADRYFGEFQREWKRTGVLPWNLHDDLDAAGQFLYLSNRHFPELLDTKDPVFGRYLLELGQDMVKHRMNSFRGSMAALGLGGLWTLFEQADAAQLKVSAGTPRVPLATEGRTVKRVGLEIGRTPVEIGGNGTWNLYYQLTERGYDRASPATAVAEQLAIERVLLNGQGEKTAGLDLEDKLHIRFGLHPDRALRDVAVVMLIPGGFEIDLGEEGLAARKSLPVEGKPLWQPDYIDVQEDRVVFFGDLDGGEKFFEFRLKPLNAGTYTVPPVFAEGMYDPEILYRGVAESIRVRE